MDYKTQAIILNQSDWQDASQFFTLYTKDHGKIVALGRATKKIQSKLNMSLQLFAVLNLTLAKGKRYDHITSVILQDNFLDLKKDYEKITRAYYGLELVDRLTTQHDPDQKIFDLLVDFLSTVERESNDNWLVVKNRFTRALLDLCGLQPPANINSNELLKKFLNQQLERPLQTELD